MKASQAALSTKFVEVPLPKFEVEDIAGATMTTDSEAGQAYQQYGKIASQEIHFKYFKVMISVSSGAELDAAAANEMLGALACDTVCEPAAQVPDDEVAKLTTSSSTSSGGGGASVGITVIAIEEPEPGKPEKSPIDNFSSMPLEELQDSFGVYKDR